MNANGRSKLMRNVDVNLHQLQTMGVETKVEMVEAVGVEPTSETTDNREHSCFSAFLFVSSATLRTGEDAATTSLIDLV